MKKLIYTLILIFSFSFLFSEARLISYSVDNFGDISRVSLNFDQKASYSFRKEANSKRIVITVPNAKNNASASRSYGLPTVSSINVQSSGSQLSIYIKTAQVFADVKEYSESGKRFSLIYHIYNTSSPETFNELFSYAKYYKYLGNPEKFNRYYQKALSLDPNNAKLKELNKNKKESKSLVTKPPSVKKKEVVKSKKDKKDLIQKKEKILKKDNKKAEIPTNVKEKPFKKIEPNKSIDKPVEKAPVEIKKAEEPVQEKVTPVKSDSVKTKAIILHNPMRKPVTRPDLIRKKVVKAPVAIDTTTVKKANKTVEEKIKPEVKAEVAPIETKEEMPKVEIKPNNQNEQLLFDFFKSVEADSARQTLILGIVASYTGANKEAINIFKGIPKENSLKPDANKYLYDVYLRMGKDYASDAKLLYAEINPDTNSVKNSASLLSINIKLWMGLAFGGLILILTALIMSLINHVKIKKKMPKVSDSDFEIHKKHLQQAYESKKQAEEKEETVEPETDYDNPPLVAEELDTEEETELKEDEEANYITIMTKDKKKNDDFDDEPESFGDEEYKKKMILKLYNDGWAIEEIAKELQISQREIEFIIKMSE